VGGGGHRYRLVENALKRITNQQLLDKSNPTLEQKDPLGQCRSAWVSDGFRKLFGKPRPTISGKLSSSRLARRHHNSGEQGLPRSSSGEDHEGGGVCRGSSITSSHGVKHQRTVLIVKSGEFGKSQSKAEPSLPDKNPAIPLTQSAVRYILGPLRSVEQGALEGIDVRKMALGASPSFGLTNRAKGPACIRVYEERINQLLPL